METAGRRYGHLLTVRYDDDNDGGSQVLLLGKYSITKLLSLHSLTS